MKLPFNWKYVRIEGVDKDTDFAQAYADYRNSTAHGSIPPISKTEKITISVDEVFYLCTGLEYGGVPYEKIKEILIRMF